VHVSFCRFTPAATWAKRAERNVHVRFCRMGGGLLLMAPPHLAAAGRPPERWLSSAV
jgi:hypothetical protein